MTKIKFEEIDEIANKYLELRKKASHSEQDNKIFKDYQNFFYSKIRYVVDAKVAKYKQFSNYSDLRQEGFEAVLIAFNSFQSDKGTFSYWADRYLKTRISRKANAHSTIKIPLHEIKNKKPFKTNEIPVMADKDGTPLDNLGQKEIQNIVKTAIQSLSELPRRVLMMKHGISVRPKQTQEIMAELSISKKEYNQILKEANEKLKEILDNMYGRE